MLLGHGDGTFQSPVTYGLTAGTPYGVAIADFNHDGKLDVAVVHAAINGHDSDVVVMLGNGNGSLGSPVAYPGGGDTILAADVDGDGRPDLVVGGGNLGLLLGNGDGSFQPPVSLSAPEGALWQAAVGDFNHDGRMDIVAAIFSLGSSGIAVFLQNPDGTFSEQTYNSTSLHGVGVAVGDLNGDSKPDVILTSTVGPAWSFLGNGDGTFQSPIRVAVGSNTAYPVLADFNHDGALDVAVADYDPTPGPRVYVKAGFGNGGFSSSNYQLLDTTGGTEVVAVGDFNGDGWLDLVSADNSGNTVTVFLNLLASVSTPLQFVASNPCRLVDTRSDHNPIQGGTSRDFLISQLGGCNLPGTASAFSLNVTVVPHGSLGYLTIWPTGQSRPTVSTMNSVDGRVKANAAIVVAGDGGAVSVYVSDTADVILDINGYFTPPGPETYQFFPLSPCRIVDTRGGHQGGTLQAGIERDYAIPGNCGVPTDATAYSFNVTAIPAAGGLDYLTVWPQGQPRPVVSTLNDPTGTVVANAAIVPAGLQNATAFFAHSNNTDLLLDVNGYFAAPGPTGLSFYPLPPCRAYDSRDNNGQPFVGERTVPVFGGPCTLPSASQAYVFNATVIPSGTMGYLTLWPDSEQQMPIVSTLNAYDGFTTSNMAIVPNLNGSIDAYAAGLTQLILDISGSFAP